MESTGTRPARQALGPRAEGDRPDEKTLKEETNKEIAERIASPPEQPTPTQAEADAIKEGTYPPAEPKEPPADETPQQRTERERREARERERQQRDVKPGETPAAGYTTR